MPRPRSRFDLHLHTCWSYDATAEPAAYFAAARRMGLRCIAVTEHHHADSLFDVLSLATLYPDLRVIIAAELTVTCSIGAVDLLCYGLPAEPTAELGLVYEVYHDWQRAYGAAISAGMVKRGFDYGDERREALLRSYRPPRTLELQGLTHVRNPVQRDYFISQGWVADEEEYIALLAAIGREDGLPSYPRADFVVPAVKEAGALVAIAHPTGYFQGSDPHRMAALASELQLDGVECAHPGVPPELTAAYRRWCVERGLFSCAGSDCHLPGDIEPLLGRHGGSEDWLDELLERLGS